MVFCHKCGHENADGERICRKCGEGVLKTTADPLKTGTLLDGRYEIVRLVKSGGMGSVYEALDHRFQKKQCAVKEMLSLSNDPGRQEYFIESFKKEAKTLHKLKHLSLPGVKDYFVEGGRYYLVMDYIEGKDLDTVMRSRGKVSQSLVIRWAIEILDVLEYLHSQTPPIVYRDLKPGNVMLRSSDQKIILIDFGIARTVNPQSDTIKTGIGTPGFSPEELLYGRPEPRSDIYSLGATMHCLLTGVVPRGAFSFSPVRELNGNVSAELEGIVMKALSGKVAERFECAASMKEALMKLNKPSEAFSPVDKTIVSAAPFPPPLPKTVPSQDLPLSPTIPSGPPDEPPPSSVYPVDILPQKKGRKGILAFLIGGIILLSLAGIVLKILYDQVNKTGEWYEKGLDAYDKGNYKEAIDFFDKVLEKDSKNGDAWKMKGNTLFKERNYGDALLCYDKSLTVKPDDGDILTKKKEALKNYGDKLKEEKKYEEALKCYDKALEIDQKDAYSLYNKGLILYEQKDYDGALDCYDKVLETDSKNISVLYNKGLALYNQGKYEEVIECFDKILAIAPRSIDAWEGEGEAFMGLKKYKEAVDCFNKVLKIDSMHFPAWKNAGIALYSQKSYKEALTCFDKALEISPDDPDVWNSKGVTLAEQGKYEEAIKCYDKAIELDHSFETARINKREALKFLKR